MSTDRHIGTLIVVILKARNLPNKRHIGKQDPYCQVVFNGEKRRTKAIKRGGQHPEWDEEIRFELFEDSDELPRIPRADTPPPPPPKSNGKGPPKVMGGKFMAIACYAEDPREPDLIGETKVDLTEVLTKGETDEWFTIMYKDKYCGEVYLELTFWLDQPPPAKKVISKPTNGQYGGRGTFVPMGESPSSSYTDLSRGPELSRIGSTSSRETLPPSLRSSSSQLIMYQPPYETPSFDGMMTDFAELRVDRNGSRRQSMPPRPISAMGAFADCSTYPGHGRQLTPEDNYPSGSAPYDPAPLPDPYQPGYEQSVTQQQPAPSSFQGNRPRYSMPTSSGFMPLPQPSGFVPMSQHTAFPPQPAPAPGAYNGQIVSKRIPSSSFSTLPPTAAQSGHGTGLPSPSYNGSLSQSQYYTPSHAPLPYAQSPPPSSSFAPTSSFPHSLQVSYIQPPPPLPPASAPPSSQQSYPHSSSSPALLHHSHSAPVDEYMTPSPPHENMNVPPPPPLMDSPPTSSQPTGSRPLPKPQHQSARRPSLPIPPRYFNGTSYPTIPPPPPLPQPQKPPAQSHLALPGAPPPLPTTPSNVPQPPTRRPSLPPFPSNAYPQQQSAFQVPPPPPLPALPQPPRLPSPSLPQEQYDPVPLMSPGQAYYLPPRPPQFQQQPVGYTYSPPIPQDNYGQ